MKRKKK
jgi:hypothetical protein